MTPRPARRRFADTPFPPLFRRRAELREMPPLRRFIYAEAFSLSDYHCFHCLLFSSISARILVSPRFLFTEVRKVGKAASDISKIWRILFFTRIYLFSLLYFDIAGEERRCEESEIYAIPSLYRSVE